ncbi:hypothetical protein [Phormidesmis priestleyi]|nr:hypothetical protein [Phormidesmis priestleyi]
MSHKNANIKGKTVRINAIEYYIREVNQILGILMGAIAAVSTLGCAA